MARRRWFAMGLAAIGVAGAVSLGADGFASASVGGTNNPGPGAGSNPTSSATVASPASAAGRKLQYYSMDASGFAPDGIHDAGEDYFNLWDPSTLSNQDAGRCFNAAVHLPDGVRIVSATFFYTEGSVEFFGELNEQNLVAHTATELVDFDSSTTTSTPIYMSTVKDVAPADQVVNTQDAYSLGVCPNGNATFSGVTIAFTG